MNLKHLFFTTAICAPLFFYAQEEIEKPEPPALKSNRADENYEYLKYYDANPYQEGFADALKYISLNADKSSYLTLGGQYRPRYEYTSNVGYTAEEESYYSQRLNVHATMNLGPNVRVFAELYHGYISSDEQLPESDVLDLHQLFLELNVQSGENGNLSFRLGRQELVLGNSRLVGNREGPNMRRSFDLIKAKYASQNTSLVVLYGKEVNPQFNAFDNEFSLFDTDASNPQLWGLGAEFPIKNLNGTNALYYLGFKSKAAGFNDVFGEEVRHSIGLRRFGNVGKRVSYNTEIVYQFGDLGDNTVSAFNVETDWKYKLINTSWTPIIGLKLDWSTGDKQTGDGKVNTFNPLFVNPAIYSLAAVNTPANLTSVHPNLTLFPFANFSIFIDYALFYRTSSNDGLYTPPRFQTRQANGLTENHIGDAFGIQINYEINRNISFDLRSTYFLAGKFIEASGESESIFYFAPTLNFKF